MIAFLKKNGLLILAFLYLINPLDFIPDPFYFEDFALLGAEILRRIISAKMDTNKKKTAGSIAHD